MGRLQNKVAIITGGTSGIGLRSVELFLEEGAEVVFAGRRTDLGEKIAAQMGPKSHFIQADVSVEEDVKNLINTTYEKFGRIDCLFNNAGCPAPTGGVEGIDYEESLKAIKVLYGSVILGIKHVAPIMKKQGFGSIVNNASIAGHRAGFSSSMVYSGAKAAVLQFTRSAAMELGESGVRVTSVSPGATATGIFGKAFGMEDTAADDTTEIVKSFLAKAQPIQRAGLADDIARAALFLCSDEASFINGTDLIVDGGITAGRNWTAHQEGTKAFTEALKGQQ
jgi:NAD(P)-dependent dehydrogenase (short-subunit alcohol dehydrogenase family)